MCLSTCNPIPSLAQKNIILQSMTPVTMTKNDSLHKSMKLVFFIFSGMFYVQLLPYKVVCITIEQMCLLVIYLYK